MLSVRPLTDSPPSAGPCTSSPSSFVWKYCRMCALEVKQGVYIFGEEGRRLHIPEKIRKTVAILVLEEDSLPKKICTNCCTSLEAYTQFKDSVVDAQDKLSSIARSIEKSQEQNMLNFRNRQYLRSPKRPKLHGSNHHAPIPLTASILVPAPALLCDSDVGDTPLECEDPPSSIVSSEDEDIEANFKCARVSIPEYSSTETNLRDEDLEPIQGSSPLPPKTQQVSAASSSPEARPSISPPEQIDLVSGKSGNAGVSNISSEEEVDTEPEAYLICGLCSTRVKDKDFLVAHHLEHHDLKIHNDPVYGCSICSKTSSTYDAMRQHIYKHRLSGTFKCTSCDKSYHTKGQLDAHISSKHKSVSCRFVCNVCGKQYATGTSLAAHQNKKHTSLSIALPITSSDRDKVTGTISAVNSLVSPQPSSSLKGFKQNTVAKSNPVAFSSSTLVETIRPDGEKNSNRLIQQLDETVPEPTSPESNKEKNKEATENGYWKCDHCDKILHTKHGYDSHIEVHKGRRFNCEHCGVTYTQKSTLEHHVKVHHTNADKEFECPECRKSFKTFRQLAWHKRTHEKPLTDVVCPQCEKKFMNIYSLKTHMKIHRGSKKYGCSECPKTFYTKLKLEEHKNSHTGRRPFGCPNCIKVFSCFSNYAKHFKKHHYELLGPRGSMVPQPKMIESNNNTSGSQLEIQKHQIDKNSQKNSNKGVLIQAGSKPEANSDKETFSIPVSKSQEHVHSSAYPHTSVTSCESQPQQLNVNVAQSPLPTNSTVTNIATSSPTKASERYVAAITACSTAGNMPVTSTSSCSSTSSTLSSVQAFHCSPHVSNSGASHCHTITLHSSNPLTTSESCHPVAAHNHTVLSSSSGPIQQHAHQHSSGIHTHSAHSHIMPSGAQSQHPLQQQAHVQSVWQPMTLPSSKVYHHSAAGLTSINGMELLVDCAGPISHHSDALSAAHHSHGPHGGLHAIQVPVTVAHLSAPSHSTHLHHATNIASSNNHQPIHGSSHGPPMVSSTGNGIIPVSSSSSGAITVPNFAPHSQQNEPMELSYKLDSNNFQEMPMELTKVFQRDPLELCVRQDFQQPLMDLSSRVVNVTVAGNPSINPSSLSMNMHSNHQGHYVSAGSTNTTSNVIVPYHKAVELVERELSLNDFTGAFRQPIDLIARSDEQSNELCSEGNLVDLSLRSSFVGQDHSASSFLRELIDLSSRSDSFHGEINLTNKQHQQPAAAHPHSQLHHNNPSIAHHPSKSSTGNHHHHSNHHGHHHHHHSHSSQPNNHGSGTVTFQNVLYHDAMFSMQN